MPLFLRLLAIAFALFFLIYVIVMVRKDRAEVGQIRKWILLAFVMFIGSLFPDFGGKIAKTLGIYSYSVLVIYVLLVIILLFMFRFQLSIIRAEKKITLLTQELSILKGEKNETDRQD